MLFTNTTAPTERPHTFVCHSWRVEMKRGESVAVIYLSLLVCLALGQGTEGRGHSQHYTCSSPHTSGPLKHSQTSPQEPTELKNQLVLSSDQSHTVSTTVTGSDILHLQAHHHSSMPPITSLPLQVLVPSRGGMRQTMTPPVPPLRC